MSSGISNVSFWDAVCLTVLFAIVGTLIAQCSRKIAQLDRRLRRTQHEMDMLGQQHKASLRELATLRIAVRDDQLIARINVTQGQRSRAGILLPQAYCDRCGEQAMTSDAMVWADGALRHERCL